MVPGRANAPAAAPGRKKMIDVTVRFHYNSKKMKSRLQTVCVVAALFSILPIPAGAGPAMDRAVLSPPPVMLWAWERPEDLRFIDPCETGVAFLARTLSVRGDDLSVKPRLQPLASPPGAFLMAVVRIEADRKRRLANTEELRARMVAVLHDTLRVNGVQALQVDFDARASERSFYETLLRDLRKELPSPAFLSVTALASWCLHESWPGRLPVDEVVPMLFRMGPEGGAVRLHFEKGRDFRPPFRTAVGVSTDERLSRIPPGRRLYLFHPRPWSEGAFREATREVKR
jgi:hypothetical protein